MPRRALALAFTTLSALASPTHAGAQLARVAVQHEMPARHNWAFRARYPAADRLFNAFDYGHAILYERLWTRPGAPASLLEERELAHLTRGLLVSPPRLALEEEAIAPAYTRLVPEANAMFAWAHLLHRQLYDALADERLTGARQDSAVASLLRYYRSRPDLAFSARPKSMELMEGQPYSLAFRRGYPKFNGLIWSYHWLQLALYEPLLREPTAEGRQRGVADAIATFRGMLVDAPARMPSMMPMAPAVAPELVRRFPEIAAIFDNLHGLHDVISDVLANPAVPRDRKRAEILRAARRYRDDTSAVTTVAEWKGMAEEMGVEHMGGPAMGPRVTVPATVPAATPAPERHEGHDMAAMGSAAPASAAAATDAPLRERAVEVLDGFHRHLAHGDSLAALALLAPDARILEGGAEETVDDYRAHHLAADVEFAQAVATTASPWRLTVGPTSAWAERTTASRGVLRGRAVSVAGAELVVLTRVGDDWRIAAVHWSSRMLPAAPGRP